VLLREREGNGKESRQDKTLYESCGAFLAGSERTQLNTQIRRKLRRKWCRTFKLSNRKDQTTQDAMFTWEKEVIKTKSKDEEEEATSCYKEEN